MNPEYEQEWLKNISVKLIERFGREEISTATFVDRVR